MLNYQHWKSADHPDGLEIEQCAVAEWCNGEWFIVTEDHIVNRRGTVRALCGVRDGMPVEVEK